MLLTITPTTMISIYIQYRDQDCDKERYPHISTRGLYKILEVGRRSTEGYY